MYGRESGPYTLGRSVYSSGPYTLPYTLGSSPAGPYTLGSSPAGTENIYIYIYIIYIFFLHYGIVCMVESGPYTLGSSPAGTKNIYILYILYIYIFFLHYHPLIANPNCTLCPLLALFLHSLYVYEGIRVQLEGIRGNRRA
jgi:hypothetical protein